MQANETKLQNIIEGIVQYVIPLFQRSYSWTPKEWQVLWDDVVELCETEKPRPHFIGSIVSLPTVSVPEGVAKYLLIDGQQRLTTIFILLTLLRDTARLADDEIFAAEIHETYLVNKFKKGNDHFKLLPTQTDRLAFTNLIMRRDMTAESSIKNAYSFFQNQLAKEPIALEKIQAAVTSLFSIVSIVLDHQDNPHLVFESLNAKGRPLTQSDLIRNYFFMRIHAERQNEIYQAYWQPMQDALNENLTEFIRHFLMRKHKTVKQSEVYSVLKEEVHLNNAIDYLQTLNRFSTFYDQLLHPEKESNLNLRNCLLRLNRIEVTTAYPLLLSCYDYYDKGKLTAIEYVKVLQLLENYLIRRFVCGIPTNQLNKLFPAVQSQVLDMEHQYFVEEFATVLQSKGYPKDNEFKTKFIETKMYGGGDRIIKTKLILETLEADFQHKERVLIDQTTIEHILPQTLTDWWRTHLGEECADTHEFQLHTIGNLTLTGYNSELSNHSFSDKVNALKISHLELNRYFADLTVWNKAAIEKRATLLANKALHIWKYFGETTVTDDVTGKFPKQILILGEKINVNSWRDVLESTLNTLALLEPAKFETFVPLHPRYIHKDAVAFRKTRTLNNGFFIETNLSAKDIQKVCINAIQHIGLASKDWQIIFK
jgi:uncharacterized protein with ParB-like and HNH nuclease domain